MVSGLKKGKNGKVQFLTAEKCPSNESDFYKTLKKRVDDYFTENHLSRNATPAMIFKSFALLIGFVVTYGAILSNYFSGVALISWYISLYTIFALAEFNFCHDVAHGAFFSSQKLNRLFSYVFDITGISSYLWKVSHNLIHHVFTNVPGYDEDIDKDPVIRTSPGDEIRPMHRFQHFYAPFLYALNTLTWLWVDIIYLHKKQMVREKVSFINSFLVYFFKALHLILFLFLPMFLLSAPIWQVALGFLLGQFTQSIILTVTFQLAHVVEGVDFPFEQNGKINKSWALHELETTSDFGASNKILLWTIGGLNFQIEHHLFPHICHMHYPEISKIVKTTAKEYGYPYHEQPSYMSAVKSHFRMLKRFGKEKNPSIVQSD